MFLQYVSISGFKITTTIHFKKTCVQRNDTKSHQTYQKKSFFFQKTVSFIKKQSPETDLQKGSSKFRGRYLCRSLYLIKVVGPPTTLCLPQHRFFPVTVP